MMNGLNVFKRNDSKVALFILAAALLIFLCGWWGDFRGYAGHPGPDPLFPQFDGAVLANAEWTILPYAVVFLILFGAALKLEGPKAPKVVNTILFIQLVGGAFFWTAHTGGLSRGLYGAGYLSLFSVAWIVPSTWWIRLATSTPVAVGAIILANATEDHPRERFICICCLLGTSSGALIRWVLQDRDDSQSHH
jgi:hypothetical protein